VLESPYERRDAAGSVETGDVAGTGRQMTEDSAEFLDADCHTIAHQATSVRRHRSPDRLAHGPSRDATSADWTGSGACSAGISNGIVARIYCGMANVDHSFASLRRQGQELCRRPDPAASPGRRAGRRGLKSLTRHSTSWRSTLSRCVAAPVAVSRSTMKCS
jgi:hypothetical protein